jgi:hypothetical protein
MNVTYPMRSREQHPDHWSRPMRGRFAFRVKKARLQATDRGPDGHLTIIRNHLGAIGTRTAASIDAYLGTGIIQIAIAGSTG